MKVDSLGVKDWVSIFQYGSFNAGGHLIKSKEGGFLFAAYSGIHKKRIVKINEERQPEFTFEDYFGDCDIGGIVQLADSNYVAVGCEAADFPGRDIRFLKFNVKGEILWGQNI